MIIDEIKTGQWGMGYSTLSELARLYSCVAEGKDLDTQPINYLKLHPGKPVVYDNFKGDTGLINIRGFIMRESDVLSSALGVVTTSDIAKNFCEAIKTEHVKTIVLNIDSPGGTVAGTQSLANLIFECRGEKPIYAITDGSMLSCAYWIAAACDKIFISSNTANVGSIGVVSELKIPRKKSEHYVTQKFTSAKYKCVGEDEEKDDEIKEYKDKFLLYSYDAFLEDISKFRGLPLEDLRKLADGRVYRGQQAISNRLVDGFYDLKEWHFNKKVIEKVKEVNDEKTE